MLLANPKFLIVNIGIRLIPRLSPGDYRCSRGTWTPVGPGRWVISRRRPGWLKVSLRLVSLCEILGNNSLKMLLLVAVNA